MIDDDDDLDDFPDLTDLEWLMQEYESAPRADKTGLREMAYAWKVWLYCHENNEVIPQEIKARVDAFNMEIARNEVIRIESDEARARRAESDFSNLVYPQLILAFDDLRSKGLTVDQTCEEIGEKYDLSASSVRRYYYKYRKMIT